MIGIVVGGAEGVFEEYEKAKFLYHNEPYLILVTNSAIETFPDRINHAVTLHPDLKLTRWLQTREAGGLPIPETIWAHRQGISKRGAYDVIPVDRFIPDRGGSVGLLAVDVAIRGLGCDKVILCGVPLTREAGHFKRQRPWLAAEKYRRAWLAAYPELAPIIRSFSGWTAELFGTPDAEFLNDVH